MDKNRIITYSFLASINNSDHKISDFNDIYAPIIKRSIYKMHSDGITKGILKDIKEYVDKNYSLDIPYPFLKKITTKISYEFNDSQIKKFILYNDGAFIIDKYIFIDYEEVLKADETDILDLDKIYKEFLISNNYKGAESSIFEFLDLNRESLSNFFANKGTSNIDPKFLLQANFINYIKNIPELFDTLKKVYLGSIISSYLEHDYEDMNKNEMEFLLDSSFIIDLLGLASEGMTHTCQKIIEICNRLKYKVSVLDITIEETQSVLYKRAEEFDNYFLAKQIDPENIYNACERLNITKTDLENLSSKLSYTLQNEYNIHSIFNTQGLQNKAKFSITYEKLKERKKNPEGALHDATAIQYVREKRKIKPKTFYDANCWFVTTSKQDYEILRADNHNLSEMIKPEDLVNILWLSTPNVNSNEIIEIGLTRLVSATITNALPKSLVLKKLDENIQKYAKNRIEASDCVRLGTRIANRTLTNLEKLNDIAEHNPEDFINKIKDEIEKAKEEDDVKNKRAKDFIINLKSKYEEKIGKYKGRIDELSETHIVELNKVKEDLEEKFVSETSSIKKDFQQEKLTILLENFRKLDDIKASLDKKAYKITNKLLFIILGSYILIIILLLALTIIFSWDIMEPYNWFLAVGFLIFTYIYFVITKQTFNPEKIYRNLIENNKLKIYKNAGFDLDYYNELHRKIDILNT